MRLFSRRSLFPLAESSIDAGLMYLPVAGAWLMVYRLGIQPLGYGETIILLTALHKRSNQSANGAQYDSQGQARSVYRPGTS